MTEFITQELAVERVKNNLNPYTGQTNVRIRTTLHLDGRWTTDIFSDDLDHTWYIHQFNTGEIAVEGAGIEPPNMSSFTAPAAKLFRPRQWPKEEVKSKAEKAADYKARTTGIDWSRYAKDTFIDHYHIHGAVVYNYIDKETGEQAHLYKFRDEVSIMNPTEEEIKEHTKYDPTVRKSYRDMVKRNK